MSIAGERLFPAYDRFHEGELPDRHVYDDQFDARMHREPYGWVGNGNMTPDGTMLYSPGETIDQWEQRGGRAEAQRERQYLSRRHPEGTR